MYFCLSKHLPGGTSLRQTSIIIQATPTTHNLWCSWWIQDAWSHSLLGHCVKTQLQNWRNPTAGGPNPHLARWGRAVLNFKPKEFSVTGTKEANWKVKRCYWLKGSRCLATGLQLSVDWSWNFSIWRRLFEVLWIVYLTVFFLCNLWERKIASRKVTASKKEPKNSEKFLPLIFF